MLKSRTTWPPEGWRFFEPATGWNAPSGLDFNTLVAVIIKHRKANRQHKKSTDPEVVAQELDDYMCDWIRSHPRYGKNYSSWCTDQAQPASFMLPLPKRSRPVGAGEDVAGGRRFFQNASTGIKTWIDWFGEGKLVDKTVAENRAAICIECPQHATHKGIFGWFVGAAVQEIKAIFSALNDLNMKTSMDEKLKVCKACDCPMRAKVWAPIEIIKRHLSKEAFDRLDGKCWIRKE
jgi:hypothetical protein